MHNTRNLLCLATDDCVQLYGVWTSTISVWRAFVHTLEPQDRGCSFRSSLW